ncbi:MAG: hypothetical protein RMM58_10440 [Chloroflexota bacterium]|nr:hypothetical protein [Dehalococcoidia bacterium]MDW8254283.1 hypothetical protein [Chloroflexota bacterium]
MELYPLLKTAHILLIATWFGVDLGVATCGSLMRNRDLTLEARGAFGRLRRLLDIGPQVSMLLTVPVAVALILVGRWVTLPPEWQPPLFWGSVAVGLVWAGVTAYGHFHPERWGAPLAAADVVIRLGIAAAFLIPAALALASASGWFWLNLKSVIFGIIVACMVWVRLATRETNATIVAIAGGEKEREPRLDAQLRAIGVPIAIIWVGIVVNVFLAVLKVS